MSRKHKGGGRRRALQSQEEPTRSCVACRATGEAEEMLRFARSPSGELGFDVRRVLPGRGAYTCASSACVERAVARGGFARAFEVNNLKIDAGVLVATVQTTLTNEVLRGLGIVRAAGGLAAGRDDVQKAMEGLVGGRGVVALVLSRDLSERTLRDVLQLAATHQVLTCVRGPAMADVGAAIGRKPTGVLAVSGTPRAQALVADLRRAATFVGEMPIDVSAAPVRHEHADA